MYGRSISNPFSSKVPLQSYGNIKVEQGKLKFDGLPYVGTPFPFKDDDPEEYQPQLQHNGCCAQFDLSDRADMEQYRALCQKICDGLAQVSFEEKIYDSDIKSWRVLIRWIEPYYAPPPAAQEIIANIEKGTNPQTLRIAPETDLRQPKDYAAVTAEEAPETEPTEQESPNEPSTRYATIDQALNLLSDELADDEAGG